MHSYFQLRRYALVLGDRFGVGEDIFWLRTADFADAQAGADVGDRIQERKAEAAAFRKVRLPRTFSCAQLDKIVHEKAPQAESGKAWIGEPISPGIACGVVRIVTDPSMVRPKEWPEKVVLVAEATDPGWTPLFQRASAVVVERGGVLSHCAIVAREMGLPAVSQVSGCTEFLKDGDYVWVDGNSGRIERGALN